MSEFDKPADQSFDRYRSYLLLLARMQLASRGDVRPWCPGRIPFSGVVSPIHLDGTPGTTQCKWTRGHRRRWWLPVGREPLISTVMSHKQTQKHIEVRK